jgi:hypothetical protein
VLLQEDARVLPALPSSVQVAFPIKIFPLRYENGLAL